MPKPKIRKEVVLVLMGATLALASFGVNWWFASTVERRLSHTDAELQDIDRFLTFAKASGLEAFELDASARVDMSISHLMYFQHLMTDPDERIVNFYHALVQGATSRKASAVSALHAGTTGKTMEANDIESLHALVEAPDKAQVFADLSQRFFAQLESYRRVCEQKVLLRRELTVRQSQLEGQRTKVGHISQFLQLLGILIILAKDIVTAKQNNSNEGQSSKVEPTDRRIAA